MTKKIITTLVVLVLVMTSVFVITEETQAADPDYLTLSDILDSDTYWVKGTVDGDNVMTLTNTSSDKYIPLTTENGSTATNVAKVVPGAGFNIPNRTGMSVTTVPFYIDKNVTVNGTFGSLPKDNKPLTEIAENVTVTFDGAKVGFIDSHVITTDYYEAKIELKAGSSVALNNYTLTYELTIFNESIQVLELVNMKCDGVKITNSSTTGAKKIDFTGDMSGLNIPLSKITIGSASSSGKTTLDVTYSFTNFSTQNLKYDVNGFKDLFMYNDSKIIELDVNGADVNDLGRIKSAGDKNLLIIHYNKQTTRAVIDSNGLDVYYVMMTMAGEGIKSIDEDKRIFFVRPGETLDLTSIVVSCESGYHFVGWYTMNDEGNMVKILNPDKYVAVSEETLYAIATADASPVPTTNDYTGFYIAIVILLVLAILVACVYIYMRYSGMIG